MDELLKNVDLAKLRQMSQASEAASRQIHNNPRAPIREQVKNRLALARAGTALQAMSKAMLDGPAEARSAPLMSPPIANGMTATVEKILGTLMKHQSPSESEYQQIPGLFRRLRYLLRVYYDAVITNKRTQEFQYCHVQDINDVGIKLHEVGVFLQLSPARLRALIKTAPDMEAFILDDPIDIGKWRLKAEATKQSVKADIEATDDDRIRYMNQEDNAGHDCAAFQMAFFIGDMLVAFILNPILDEADRLREGKAMMKLVEISTSTFYRFALGDPLTDAMRPVYWTPKAMLRFAHAGGLPALIGDWAEATGKNGICQQTMDKLPNKVWDHQTEASLLGVMRELITKVEKDGDVVVTTPIFANIMHQIYSRYGLDPFERASTLSDSTILFYFIYRRLSKRPQKFQSAQDWIPLLQKYCNVPQTTSKRHGWTILSLSGRWDCLDLYGCANIDCPERAALHALKRRRVRGKRDPAVEERLLQWGAASKACVRCKHVSYCGVTCQKADWPKHKPTCKTEAAKGKYEDI